MNETPQVTGNKDAKDNAAISALGYVGILCFIPLLMKKNSDFAQFHAKQGLALFIVELVAFVLSWTIFLAWLSTIIWLVATVASIYGIIQALNGKKTEIPGLTPIVSKLNL